MRLQSILTSYSTSVECAVSICIASLRILVHGDLVLTGVAHAPFIWSSHGELILPSVIAQAALMIELPFLVHWNLAILVLVPDRQAGKS